MTLGILEGTILDLGEFYWSLVAICALAAIEYFELGPHIFRGPNKDRDLPSASLAGPEEGVAKIHKIIQERVQKEELFLREDGALLYVESEKFSITSEDVDPPLGLSEQQNCVITYKATEEDSACSAVLEKLDGLLQRKGGEQRHQSSRRRPQAGSHIDKGTNIILYTKKMPSAVDVHEIADKTCRYSRKASIQVLYEEANEEEEDDEKKCFEERYDYLKKHGVTLMKITDPAFPFSDGKRWSKCRLSKVALLFSVIILFFCIVLLMNARLL